MRDALHNGTELFKAGFRSAAPLALAGSLAANAPRLLGTGISDLSGVLRGEAYRLDASLLAWVATAQLVALFFHVAVAVRLHAVAHNRQLTLVAALSVAIRRSPAMLTVLATVTLLIVAGVVLAGLTANGIAFALLALTPLYGAADSPMFPLAIVALTLVLALPLATVLVYWYFAFFLVVTEGRGGLAALRRSFHLVRGNLWRMKLALTAVYFAFFAALLLAEALAAAASALLGGAHLPGGLAAFVIVVLGGAVAGPLPIAASLALLYDLAARPRHSTATP